MKALGDCLEVSRGFAFSAFDRDNDGEEKVNCAMKYGMGWWFGNCSSGAVCSVFGLSPHGITPAQEDNVVIFPGLNLSVFRDILSSRRWYIYLNLVDSP